MADVSADAPFLLYTADTTGSLTAPSVLIPQLSGGLTLSTSSGQTVINTKSMLTALNNVGGSTGLIVSSGSSSASTTYIASPGGTIQVTNGTGEDAAPINIDVAPLSNAQLYTIFNDGITSTRGRLRVFQGPNLTASLVDNPGQNSSDLTLSVSTDNLGILDFSLAASMGSVFQVTGDQDIVMSANFAGANNGWVISYDSAQSKLVWAAPGGGGGGIEAIEVDAASEDVFTATTDSGTTTIGFASGATNGQVPQYNSTTSKWEFATIGGGGSGLTSVGLDIDDNASAILAVAGSPLTADGAMTLSFDVSTATTGQVPQYDGTNVGWATIETQQLEILPSSEDVLTISDGFIGFLITGTPPANNSVPTYSSAGGGTVGWAVPDAGVTNVTVSDETAPVFNVISTSGGTITLGFMLDAPPADNSVPTFNSTSGNMEWAVPAGLTSVGLDVATNAENILAVTGSPLTANGALDLAFNFTTASSGQVPLYNGTTMVWAHAITSIQIDPTASDVLEVQVTGATATIGFTFPGGIADGWVLTYNGTTEQAEWRAP